MTTHFFGDTAVLTGRSLKHVTRSMDTIITTAVIPVAMMLMFVYVFGGAIQHGSGTYVSYMLPGILLITIASGISYTAFRLFTDTQAGIFERFQSMPIARSGVLWAHVLTSLIANLISLAIVVGVALIMGFSTRASVGAWLAVAGILILFTLALTWIAVIPGLTASTVSGASAFSYPLIFLPFVSSAFAPTATMPGPVRTFAGYQPVTPIVNTIRDLFAQQPVGDHIWIALAWCAGILIVAYVSAIVTYHRKIGLGSLRTMLTISQLAAYAGVTVRAVRHYHKIGLLPEPKRDHSGYRTYDAAAVVRLIRIHILADAGVPLARVQELLDADQQEFTRGVQEIDKNLRAEIRRLQHTRTRIARLAAGEHLALPESVVDYLNRLRGLGVEERYIELERDAWIMVAAQVPHLIDYIMATKHEELDDPDMVALYRLISDGRDWPADDPRVIEVADIVECLMIRAVKVGKTGDHVLDESFVNLLDTTMIQSAPAAERLRAILEERGWRGWTRIERVPDDRLTPKRGTS
jgi:ABC-2 type transport system permease protein